jgi:hypothetical protein
MRYGAKDCQSLQKYACLTSSLGCQKFSGTPYYNGSMHGIRNTELQRASLSPEYIDAIQVDPDPPVVLLQTATDHHVSRVRRTIMSVECDGPSCQ